MSIALNRSGRRQRGFSLIEVMVGLTVGLLAILAITQTLSMFENQKRNTTANADAQENGLVGLFTIEQDARKAAAGFTHPEAFNCQNFYSYFSTGGLPGAPIPTDVFNTTPVSITDGGSGNPDVVTVRTGVRFLGSIPTKLKATMTNPWDPLIVERIYDFTDSDVIMVVSSGGTNCTLMRVTSIDAANFTLQHAGGQDPDYNPSNTYMTTNSWPGYAEGSSVFRVGTAAGGGVASRTYSVNASNSLQASVAASGAAPNTEVLASEIVELQAQYGIADAGSQQINDWVSATGAWAAPSVANRQRIKAIRVVVVARSGKRDAAVVTNTCTNNAGTNYGPCAWSDSAGDPAPLIDLRANAGDTEWQHYRYKTYQTVIPMRNVMWSNL
jgi:type IV pilus assembly protein PilW